jgi:hypothetical protein
MSTSQRLVSAGTDPDMAKIGRQQFTEPVDLLEHTFEAVRRIAGAMRQTAQHPEQPVARHGRVT